MPDTFIYLIEIQGPEAGPSTGLPQNRVELAQGKTTIGRVAGNTIVLGHPLVSRGHAQIDIEAGSCLLMDLGSANGTSLNGRRLQSNVPEILHDNAIITIGPFELHFTATLISTTQEPQLTDEELRASLGNEAGPKNIASAGKQRDAETPPIEEIEPSAPDEQAVDISRIITPGNSQYPRYPAGGDEPPRVPPPYRTHTHTGEPDNFSLPPGLDFTSLKLINYIPGIYHTDFMSRFLALFESILTPIKWNIDNFDMYLDPGTAPDSFLPWLANWYLIGFDSTWSEAQRRSLLSEASDLYARRGTRWALIRLLEIYTGRTPDIIEFDKNLPPYTFIIRLPIRAMDVNRELIIRLIDANKPAYTNYSLEFFQ